MYNQPDPQIAGWMSDCELEWLCEKASQMDSVVEIGCWKGRSTHALLSGCLGKVFAVDHFQGNPGENDIGGAHGEAKTADIHEILLKNVGHFPNLVILKMDSVEASKLFNDKEIDMVFIDGDHTREGFEADLNAWLPKCRKMICGHDITQDGVPKVLEGYKGKFQTNPLTSIWSMEIKNL